MNKKILLAFGAGLPLALFASNVQPISLSSQSSSAALNNLSSKFKVNGFISAGAAKTSTAVNYAIPGHGAVNKEPNFDVNSLLGLQITANMTKQLSAVLQLVADGEDINGGQPYKPSVDWAFVKYAVNSNLDLRAGRFRMPAFMYSDTQEVGYSYPWVTLPNEVYRIIPFQNMNGFDAVYKHELGASGWDVSFQPFVGANESQFTFTSDQSIFPNTSYTDTVKFDENKMWGASVKVGNNALSLRASYAQTALTTPDILDSTITALEALAIDGKIAKFYGAGINVNKDHFLFDSEWAHRETPNNIDSLTGYYAMLGYRYHKWLPNVTYGHLKTTNTSKIPSKLRGSLPQAQRSITPGLDYYFNQYVVGKASVSFIKPLDGTRGLFDHNGGTLPANVKLYAVSLDVLF